MKNNKNLTAPDVGIIVAILCIIASIVVIAVNWRRSDGIAIGIALLGYSVYSLLKNIKSKRNSK